MLHYFLSDTVDTNFSTQSHLATSSRHQAPLSDCPPPGVRFQCYQIFSTNVFWTFPAVVVVKYLNNRYNRWHRKVQTDNIYIKTKNSRCRDVKQRTSTQIRLLSGSITLQILLLSIMSMRTRVVSIRINLLCLQEPYQL